MPAARDQGLRGGARPAGPPGSGPLPDLGPAAHRQIRIRCRTYGPSSLPRRCRRLPRRCRVAAASLPRLASPRRNDAAGGRAHAVFRAGAAWEAYPKQSTLCFAVLRMGSCAGSCAPLRGPGRACSAGAKAARRPPGSQAAQRGASCSHIAAGRDGRGEERRGQAGSGGCASTWWQAERNSQTLFERGEDAGGSTNRSLRLARPRGRPAARSQAYAVAH